MVKFGNVASEHVKSAISVVQPQLSAAQQNPSAKQQNRVGTLVTHHLLPGMSHHTGGSRQGPHGTPVPNSGKAMGGPIRRLASQQLIDTFEMQKLLKGKTYLLHFTFEGHGHI